METQATKTSWKNFEMPPKKVKIDFQDSFTEDEFEIIKKGVIPEVMEDKWFIYYQDNCIYLQRSWTGYCIFQVFLKIDEGKYKISEVWMNNDPRENNYHYSGVDLLNVLLKTFVHKTDASKDMENYLKSMKKRIWPPSWLHRK